MSERSNPSRHSLSLFSGIGGGDWGMKQAGWKCVAQCEIDPFRRKVLARHWPNVRRFEDVRDIRGADFAEREGKAKEGNATAEGAEWTNGQGRLSAAGVRRVERDEQDKPLQSKNERTCANDARPFAEYPDLIIGGFPCQDLSVAGRRAGLAGERSGLFFEFARIVGEVRPTWFVIENVPGLLSSNKGADFDVVLNTMGQFGYGMAWRILDSRYFGVPQRRRRVYVVGCLGEPARAAAVLFEREGVPRHTAARQETGEGVAAPLGASTSSYSGYRGDLDHETHVPEVVGPLIANQGPNTHGSRGVNSLYDVIQGHAVISGSVSSKWRKQSGGPAGDETYNLVASVNDGADGWSGRSAEYNLVSETLRIGGRLRSASYGTASHNKLNGSDQMPMTIDSAVRRLTPTECERLQALPDDFSHPHDPPFADGCCADGPRYAALGDAMTASVVYWIGARMQ